MATRTDITALTAKPTVQIRRVLIRAYSDARGLAPVARRCLPDTVRWRTKARISATTTQIRTVGGTSTPKVLVEACAAFETQVGGIPVRVVVWTWTAPTAIAPIANVVISGWIWKRWQIWPAMPPRSAAPITARITITPKGRLYFSATAVVARAPATMKLATLRS